MTLPPIATTVPVGPAGAPLLVLGCSLGTPAGLWDAALPALAASRRVSIWELPGHGQAPATNEHVSIETLADAVAAAFDEPFDYAGVSIGGAVALALAARHGEQVRSVAAVCSGAAIGTPAGWAERAAQVRASGTSSLISGSAGRWFAPGTIAREPTHTSRLLHTLSFTDDESYARCCEALGEFDGRSLLSSINVPVLAAWGTHDQVAPQALSEEIADTVRDGHVAEITGASHLPPVDDPDQTARLLLRFLSSLENGST